MGYTTYYEESDTVGQVRYEQMKKTLLAEQPKKRFERYHLKKLRFVQMMAQDELYDDAVPKYYLCIKNRDDTQIYMEKKYTQNGIVYKRCEKVTREEAEKILNQDVVWMKNHKRQLFIDFYLEYTLNGLKPNHITEYQREAMMYKKGCHIIFAHGVSRVAGGETDIFSDTGIHIQCLSEGHVFTSYKREVTIPQMIINMMQIPEDSGEDVAFAF